MTSTQPCRQHRGSPEGDQDVVGRSLDEVTTPALVLDLEMARRNVDAMATRIAGLPAGLRPHIKAHKSAEIARMQIEAGALGVTTATAAEAVAMAEAGVADVLVANQVVSIPAMTRLASAAGMARIHVAVDDAGNLAELGRAASAAGVELGVLVELDVGLGRGGVRTVDEVAPLADRVSGTPGVSFDGVYGYEGHCASEPDPVLRATEVARSMELLAAAARSCRDAGFDVRVVSAGATGTFELTGAAPEVTEVQAGSYVLMDRFHAGLVEGFGSALTVMATVIGRHDDLVVLDAGRKSVDVGLRPLESPDPRAVVEFVHEEHVGLRFDGEPPYAFGERVRIVPGYAPTTVNLFGTYVVVEGDRVVDVWKVLARHGTP